MRSIRHQPPSVEVACWFRYSFGWPWNPPIVPVRLTSPIIPPVTHVPNNQPRALYNIYINLYKKDVLNMTCKLSISWEGTSVLIPSCRSRRYSPLEELVQKTATEEFANATRSSSFQLDHGQNPARTTSQRRADKLDRALCYFLNFPFISLFNLSRFEFPSTRKWFVCRCLRSLAVLLSKSLSLRM